MTKIDIRRQLNDKILFFLYCSEPCLVSVSGHFNFKAPHSHSIGLHLELLVQSRAIIAFMKSISYPPQSLRRHTGRPKFALLIKFCPAAN